MAKTKKSLALADLAFLVPEEPEEIKITVEPQEVLKEKKEKIAIAVKNGMTYRCKDESVWVPSGMYGSYISGAEATEQGYIFFDSIEDYLKTLESNETSIHGEGHEWIDDQGVLHWSQGMLFRQRY